MIGRQCNAPLAIHDIAPVHAASDENLLLVQDELDDQGLTATCSAVNRRHPRKAQGPVE